MIEKLKRYIREEDGVKISCPPTNEAILMTINALVDAVNELQTTNTHIQNDLHEMRHLQPKTRAKNVQSDTESRPENVQDKFAEQRKWIGKICKFWDIDNYYLYYGPLTKISDTGPYYYECNHRICYVHCEPVKDDIIYKGE